MSRNVVRSKVRQWAHNEHHKHWLNTKGCRQAKELVTQVTTGLTQFALRQCHRDLKHWYIFLLDITPLTGILL